LYQTVQQIREHRFPNWLHLAFSASTRVDCVMQHFDPGKKHDKGDIIIVLVQGLQDDGYSTYIIQDYGINQL